MHGNTGDSGSDLTSYQVEDILPAGVRLEYFDTGEFPATSNPINVYYQTNTGGSWVGWPGNPVTTTDVEVRKYVSDLGLPGGDYVSAIRFNLGTVPGGGAFYPDVPGSEEMKLKVELVDPSAWSIGDSIDNTATVSAGGYSESDTHTVQLTSDYGNLAFTRGASVVKWAADGSMSALQSLGYELDHGNTGGSGSDLSDYLLEEVAPAGAKFETFTTGRFPGPAIPIQVNYHTNLDASWTAWSGTYWSDSESWIYEYELPLGAGEYVTGFQLVYGTLPGGGGYHPDADGQSDVDIWMKLVDPASWSAGDSVTNCATVHARMPEEHDEDDDYIAISPSDCATINIIGAVGDYTLYQWEATADPYLPGETYRVGITYGTDPESGKPMTDPVVAYLLAEEFEYVGNETHYGWGYTDGGSPAPSVAVVDDFAGTGRQLVRYGFSPLTISPNGSWHHGHVELDVRVKDGTPNGYYTNEAYGSWDPDGEGHWWFVTDTFDADGDGSTTDLVARSDRAYSVDAGNSTAALDSVMWVKGALDSNWSRYPDSGKTTPAGEADYELRITNTGEVAIRDVVIIDILPHVGDNGVIDTSARGSEWEPYLVGAVAAPAGVTVYYSQSKNPCRDELTPGVPSGCEDPQWTTSPGDVASVKSLKFDLGGNIIVPSEEVIIGWPMRAPISAPRTGEIAWNSFGFTGVRTDNGVQLLPSEPVKVGIEVEPPTGGSYGDLVWDDLNNNGVQDVGEPGINGLRVELYRDNGDGIEDPATDTLEQFTLTTADGPKNGAYLFTNLTAGDYYAVVEAPNGFTPSLTQSQSVSQGPNELTNGSLEDGLAGWSSYGGGSISVQNNTSENPFDGDFSGRLSGKTSPLIGVVHDLDIVEPSTDYFISLAMKTGGAPVTAWITLLIDGIPRDLFSFPSLDSTIGAGSWTAVAGAVTTPAFASYTSAQIVITTESVDDFAFDGLSMSSPVSSSQDSDGIADTLGSLTVAKMPMTSMTASGETQLDWDQGFVAKMSLPSVWAMKEDGAGRILIGGGFVRSHGVVRPNVARLMSDGSLDESFDPGTGPDGVVRALDIRPDGRIVLGGAFDNYNGQSTPGGLALVEPSGLPGAALPQPDSKTIRYIGIDGNGRAIVAGAFQKIGGVSSPGIACLSSSGSIDGAFASGLSAGDTVYTVLPMADGSMLIGGSFSAYAGVTRPGVAKINDSGTLDPEFDPGGGTNGSVRQIYVQEDQKLIVVGDFTSFAGHAVNGTVRLRQSGMVDVALGESELVVRRVESSN